MPTSDFVSCSLATYQTMNTQIEKEHGGYNESIKYFMSTQNWSSAAISKTGYVNEE